MRIRTKTRQCKYDTSTRFWARAGQSILKNLGLWDDDCPITHNVFSEQLCDTEPHYHLTWTSFYLIRKRERAKYPSVLHRCSYYTLGGIPVWSHRSDNERNFSRMINPLFDGFTDNTCEYFTRCSHFFSSFPGLKKNYATRKICARFICYTIE